MNKTLLRKFAETIAPGMTKVASEARWLRQHADELGEALRRATSIEEQVAIACALGQLRSNQMRIEIIALLYELKKVNPQRLCEIGADKGGTLSLFAATAAANAKILSLDLHYPESRASVYKRLSQPMQKLTCHEGDSHSLATLKFVERWLGDDKLDFLFIDGDHSYSGVKADYEMYSPLVRSGGLIAFHDIVPDYFTRFGQRTLHDVGEVPRYWTELKATVRDWNEFIENPEQDGYGIGLIRVE